MSKSSLLVDAYITESFDKIYSYEWIERDSDYWLAMFKNQYRTNYEVIFKKTKYDDVWSVEFDTSGYSASRPKSFTDQGDALAILSTVTRVIDDFLKINTTEVVFFKGNTSAHHNVYKKMIKKLASRYKINHKIVNRDFFLSRYKKNFKNARV